MQLTDGAIIERKWRQVLQTPMGKFSSRGASRAEKEKRGEGGVRGAFYRRPCMEEGLGFPARGARSMAKRKSCSGRAPAQGGRKPRQVGHPYRCLAWRRHVPFRYGWILGRGLVLWPGRMASPRPFSISLILFPFSFSDSCFIS
jgi:hypothetical protein